MARKARSKRGGSPGKKSNSRRATPKAAPQRRAPAGDRATGGRPGIAEMRTYIRAEGAKLLDINNVNSIGIGYKIKTVTRDVNGTPVSEEVQTNQLCLQFTVDQKGGGSQLEALETEELPRFIQIGTHKVPTDVIERKFHAGLRVLAESSLDEDPRKTRQQTIAPGMSVSHPTVTAGTIGAFVFDQADASVCVLSNWHVLQGPHGKEGDPIVQPGSRDDSRVDQNRAGVLVRSYLGIAGDGAIARVEGRAVKQEVMGLKVVPRQIGEVALKDKVIKSGRTTGVTHGVVTRVEVTTRMNYPGRLKAESIGCFEIGPDPRAPKAPQGEISAGGDSGALWIAKNNKGKASDIVVGLHFAGESVDNPQEYALACYPHRILKKLGVGFAPPAAATTTPQAGSLETADGPGYDANFLTVKVPLPTLSAAVRTDAPTHNNSPVLTYTHYSVVMSKKRALARYAAWNIDGSRNTRVSTKGVSWKYDDRIDRSFQCGADLYSDSASPTGSNPLDRGHIAKREDVVWGSVAEAQRANRDSFTWTNCTPQHEDYNQEGGLWHELEDLIFKQVDVQGLKVCVFGGPIFQDNDREIVRKGRKYKLPREFWKIVSYVDSADDKLRAKAFILSQADLIANIEALDLSQFQVFQVPVSRVATRTKLGFGVLEQAGGSGGGPESLEDGPRPLRSVADIDLS